MKVDLRAVDRGNCRPRKRFAARAAHAMLAPALIVAIVFAPGAGARSGSETIYATGFEPFPVEDPGFELGDLDGQNGWLVLLFNATGLVQEQVVSEGSQAVEIIDGFGHGRGERDLDFPLSGIGLTSQYDMLIPPVWDDNMAGTFFRASNELIFLDADGFELEIEFGLIRTDVKPYQDVPPQSAAFFVDVTFDNELLSHGSTVVNFNDVAGEWHRYQLNFTGSSARLLVDGELRAVAAVGPDVETLHRVRLWNQRWGTNSDNSESLYFDSVRIEETPTPPPICPERVERVRGIPIEGDLKSLCDSDDDRYSTRPDVFNATVVPPVQVRMEATSPVDAPSVLRFTLEASVTEFAILQRFLAFDFVAGRFEVLDARLGSRNEDETVVVEIDVITSRFIEPQTGRMVVLVQYLQTQADIRPVWLGRIDRVTWEILP